MSGLCVKRSSAQPQSRAPNPPPPFQNTQVLNDSFEFTFYFTRNAKGIFKKDSVCNDFLC